MEPSAFGESFRIETSEPDRGHVIKVAGELDSGTCALLSEAFERVIADAGSGEVTLDFTDVSFIDSTGMRTMIEIERAATQRGLRLVVLPPPDDITELLRTAGIAERMNLAGEGPGDEAALSPELLGSVAIELEREPTAPRRARAEVREALAEHLGDEDIATVVLLTSELVTNAVVHPEPDAGATIGLEIAVHDNGVRVEVEDPGDGFDPKTPEPTATQGGGRGLYLVDQCAARWGARRTGGERFLVWFEFTNSEREPAAAHG